MESVGKHFEVMTSTGKLLFSAGTEQVVVGADKLTITGMWAFHTIQRDSPTLLNHETSFASFV